MKRAYFEISSEALGQVLRLPEGIDVKGILYHDPIVDIFRVFIVGNGLPEVPEIEMSPEVHPIIEKGRIVRFVRGGGL